jgi:hypothetical protein
MIPRIGEVPATRRRYAAAMAKDARGVPVRPAPVTASIRIVTDQAPRSVVERYGAGRRLDDLLWCVTYDDVRAGSETAAVAFGTPADEIEYAGAVYAVEEVHRVEAWMGDPAHLEVIGIKVTPRRVGG